MTARYNVTPIGFVRSSRTTPTDDDWDNVSSAIELDQQQFDADSLIGLESFSHVEILFVFHQVSSESIHTGKRHPRGRKDWPEVGIFAQRVKNRPNRIGATTCRILSVSGTRLEVKGLDAIDGSPVIDIKPVMQGFEPRGSIMEPDWAREILSDYWKIRD